jgi:DMSO/TMAO reductase YedYZ molybdopterin-dependent catalytic subunit
MRRRDLLWGAAASVAGCWAQDPRAGLLGALGGITERAEAALFRPDRLGSAPPSGDLTPDTAFPAYRIGDSYPEVPAGWVLEVGGQVARPQNFSLEFLQRLPRTDLRVRHHCVEGWSAVASWHGVRLSEVAALVGADPAAAYVEFVSFEPVPDAGGASREADAKAPPGAARRVAPVPTYTSSWDRASALHPQTLLAYGMNGAPLGRLHGGPVRLYASTKLGYKMVKWLAGLRFLSRPTGGYWEDQGYEWFAGV